METTTRPDEVAYQIIYLVRNEISAGQRDSFAIQMKGQLNERSIDIIKRVFPLYDVEQEVVKNPITEIYVHQLSLIKKE